MEEKEGDKMKDVGQAGCGGRRRRRRRRIL